MANADPPSGPDMDGLDGRPTLIQQQDSRGDLLARDEPPAPGTGRRLSVQPPDGYSRPDPVNRAEARQRNYTVILQYRHT